MNLYLKNKKKFRLLILRTNIKKQKISINKNKKWRFRDIVYLKRSKKEQLD